MEKYTTRGSRGPGIHSLAFVLLLVVALAGTASAAQISGSPGDTLALDWETAWSLAIEQNEEHHLAINEVEKADRQVGQAYSAAMPTVEFNGTFNHYFEIPTNPVVMPGELNFQNPGVPFEAEFQFAQENMVTANLQLTQPLWLAGKVGLGLRVAKEFRKISRLGVQVSREDLRVKLLEAFYGALLAEESVHVARESLEQAKNYQEQVRDMHEQGVVSEYDLIRAGVQVSNLKPNVAQAEAQRDLARKNLKNMLGVHVNRPLRLEGNLDMVLAPPEMAYEEASRSALKQRLELEQLELQERLYGYQYTAEKRNWLWPNFLAGLRWETQAQDADFAPLDYDYSSGLSGQLILQIPLFDGFASHHKAQIAKVNQRNVRLQRNMLERGIQMQVFSAMREYQRADEALLAAQENLVQARKGYEIAKTRYSGGVGTQIEVLDAQLQLNVSKVRVLQAKYEKMLAKAQYDRAVGSGFQDPAWLSTEEER